MSRKGDFYFKKTGDYMKIAAAYVRVSTEDQTELSPTSQIKQIREYAKNHGYIVPDEFGITPAPAGKTRRKISKVIASKDHPRTCGENTNIFCFASFQTGSPPHLRGKPTLDLDTTQEERITPAPAGKTLTISVLEMVERDHPRTCGEN